MSQTQVTSLTTLPAAHDDMIHDCQLDYYGKVLASAGSDRKIKIFDVVNGERVLTAELTGHEGPVWNVAWAHPQYGTVLASCSYDRQVYVWKEHAPQHWGLIHKYLGHEGSVNAVSWCPHEAGLRLACASSDENVSVLSHCGGGQWTSAMFKAHKTGCNAVAWAPFKADAVDATTGAGLRLATGGCDNLVRLWTCEGDGVWTEQAALPPIHTDWVRDVAWAPSPGPLGGAVLASCAQDRLVVIWSEGPNGDWSTKTLQLPAAVWSVSWSITGGILAVASGDNQVTLWREDMVGDWTQIGQVSENQPPANVS